MPRKGTRRTGVREFLFHRDCTTRPAITFYRDPFFHSSKLARPTLPGEKIVKTVGSFFFLFFTPADRHTWLQTIDIRLYVVRGINSFSNNFDCRVFLTIQKERMRKLKWIEKFFVRRNDHLFTMKIWFYVRKQKHRGIINRRKEITFLVRSVKFERKLQLST